MTPDKPRNPGIYLMTCMENNYEPEEVEVSRGEDDILHANLKGVTFAPLSSIHDGLTYIQWSDRPIQP